MDPCVSAGSHAHLRILPFRFDGEAQMRARSIKPGFFRNADLLECDPLTRILFAGLWCLADRDGRLIDRPKQIKIEVMPCDNCDVDAMLTDLASKGFIIRYQHDGKRFLQVQNFLKHQNPHVKEPPSDIPAPCEHSSGTIPAPCEHSSGPADSPFLTPDSGLQGKSGASCDEKPSPSHPQPVTSKPLPPHKRVTLDPTTHQWHGITQEDMEALKSAYPACCVSTELLRAAEWVKANPEKRKSNWYRFLVNWLNRTQNGGGTKMARASPENQGPCSNPWEKDPDYDPWRLQ